MVYGYVYGCIWEGGGGAEAGRRTRRRDIHTRESFCNEQHQYDLTITDNKEFPLWHSGNESD